MCTANQWSLLDAFMGHVSLASVSARTRPWSRGGVSELHRSSCARTDITSSVTNHLRVRNQHVSDLKQEGYVAGDLDLFLSVLCYSVGVWRRDGGVSMRCICMPLCTYDKWGPPVVRGEECGQYTRICVGTAIIQPYPQKSFFLSSCFISCNDVQIETAAQSL